MRSLFLLCLSSFIIPHSSFSAQPNFLMVFIDDMGWGDLSCFGNRDVKTPNVDRLIEVMDMREAQRSYSANLSVLETTRGMLMRTIDALKS